MARLDRKSLGELRGKLGGIVGKVRDGKHYISAAPKKYKISQKPREVEKRSRFKVNGQFAKFIRQVDILFRVWDKAKVPANNAYNKISKLNFKLCRPERPSDKNVITPGGFLMSADIKSFPGRIEAELEPFDLLAKEARVVLVMIVSFYHPQKPGYNFFELTHPGSYEQDGLNFIFRMNAREEMLDKDFKHKTVYLAAVTEDEKGNIVRFSSTVGKEL